MKAKKQRQAIKAQEGTDFLERDIRDLFEKEKELKKLLTPLKVRLRLWFRSNWDKVIALPSDYYEISWAVDKIECGYFGTDLKLSAMVRIIEQLKEAKIW